MSDENKEVTPGKSDANKPWGMEVKVYCMLMHLSQLAVFVIPGAGLVIPILMWALNKDEHSEINLNGLIILNWMLSALIYSFVCFLLIFIFIGIPLMFILGLVALIFAVVGGIKANEGQYWPYPMSIDFFGVKRRLTADDSQL